MPEVGQIHRVPVRQLDGLFKGGDGTRERAELFVRLSEESVREDERWIELQRLRALYDGLLVLPRVEEMPPHVHVQHEPEWIALQCPAALRERLLGSVHGPQEM